MNYKELSTKEYPFENLSESEAKKLVVYFHHFATPPMNDEEIYRKYGFVLPCGGMTITEDMQLMLEVMRELVGNW